MAKKQTLGEYLKRQEACWDARLPLRTPYVVRLDGRGFHQWTRKTGCKRPFDHRLGALMGRTLRAVCEEMEVAVFGYAQSDEMSVLVRGDLGESGTQEWYDGRVEKNCSLAAAFATRAFNEWNDFPKRFPAYFDARVISLPVESLAAYFIWRQNDARENSLSMLAQSLYSPAELHGKRRSDLHELCFQKGVNWGTLPIADRRGWAVYRVAVKKIGRNGVRVVRHVFREDGEVPVFEEAGEWLESRMRG